MATFFVYWGNNILIECNDAGPKLIKKVEVIVLHDIKEKDNLKKQYPHARWIQEDQAPKEVKEYIERADALANDFGQDLDRDDYPIQKQATNGTKINCETPAPTIQTKCEDLPRNKPLQILIGHDKTHVVLNIDGTFIDLTKEAALQLGQSILDNAFKL